VVNYNPLPNWTIKVTATKIKTANSDTVKEINAWEAVRKAVWDNAKAIDYLNDAAKAKLTALGATLSADGSGYEGYQVSTNASSEQKGVLTTFWASTNYRNANGATTITSNNVNGWTTGQGYYDNVYASQYALQKDLDGQQVMGQRKYNFNLVTNYSFDRGSLKGWAIGGAQRWSSKAIIGFFGKDTAVDPDDLYDASDVTRPIYDDSKWYTDLWVSYTRKIFNDKVRMKLQLNVTDVFQDGELQPIAADKLGQYYAYRIVDPRMFILTATFDF
jgi:hypothetical protein